MTESIFCMSRKTAFTTASKNKHPGYSPSQTIIEDTMRYNIAHVTTTSKAYILGLLVTIIKCNSMRQVSTPR